MNERRHEQTNKHKWISKKKIERTKDEGGKKKGKKERMWWEKRNEMQEHRKKSIHESNFTQQSHKTCTLMNRRTGDMRGRALSLYHTPKKLSPLLLLLKSPWPLTLAPHWLPAGPLSSQPIDTAASRGEVGVIGECVCAGRTLTPPALHSPYEDRLPDLV